MKQPARSVAVEPADTPWAQAQMAGAAMRVSIGGRWTLAYIKSLDAALAGLDTKGAATLEIDFAEVAAIDTGGAWTLHRQLRRWQEQGADIALVHASHGQTALLERMGVENEARAPLLRPSGGALAELIVRTGKGTSEIAHEARAMIAFVGAVAVSFAKTLAQPGRVRLVSTVHHIERIGIDAIPIMGLLAFLIGVVLAFQGADQLRQYGAEVFTINLLGVSILREIGVLITSIMVAGRTGSAFAAEIGTMKVNQEIDAMRTIGLDPMDTLVLPRVLALLVALPLLVFFANAMALAGGATMVILGLDLSLEQFIEQLSNAVDLGTLAVGLIKAPVFAVLIGMVACYEGLKVSGSAESVGIHTTRSVVKSIFLVIVFDAAFSIFFSRIGL
jgi:phospholipid/cholesterol/gamma-HCH transport system permease protein